MNYGYRNGDQTIQNIMVVYLCFKDGSDGRGLYIQ
jgi:hypothetical protein